MIKEFFISVFIFSITQIGVWFLTNGQFISNWFKNNPFILSLFGIPITYGYIYATKYAYDAFDGSLWSTRFLGFAVGTLVFAILTYLLLNQGLTLKVAVSLFLAILLLLIEIIWK
tara:strand:- start:2427 stop:2771 length:345 start_codon:yes stop_codon:yes gene_type:complete